MNRLSTLVLPYPKPESKRRSPKADRFHAGSSVKEHILAQRKTLIYKTLIVCGVFELHIFGRYALAYYTPYAQKLIIRAPNTLPGWRNRYTQQT